MRLPPGEAVGGHQRPQVELAIHWSPRNKQKVTALVDTGAECTLIHRYMVTLRSLLAPSAPLMVMEGKQQCQKGPYDTADWVFSPMRI